MWHSNECICSVSILMDSFRCAKSVSIMTIFVETKTALSLISYLSFDNMFEKNPNLKEEVVLRYDFSVSFSTFCMSCSNI